MIVLTTVQSQGHDLDQWLSILASLWDAGANTIKLVSQGEALVFLKSFLEDSNLRPIRGTPGFDDLEKCFYD